MNHLVSYNTMAAKCPNFSWLKIPLFVFGLLICFGIGISLALELYLFAFALFAITVIPVILRLPYIGLLFFVCLVYIRPQDYIPGMINKPIVLGVMLLTFCGFLIQSIVHKKKGFINSIPGYLMLGLLLIVTISTLKVGLNYAKDSFIEFIKIVFLYILIVNLTDTNRKFSVLFWLIFTLTLYIAILGILQYYGIDITGVGLGEVGSVRGEKGRIQGVGIFNNPNYLAYCVVFMLPAAVYLVYYSRYWMIKLSAFSILCVLLYCIYLTKSRGGFLCTILILGFIAFLNKSLKIKIIGAIVILCIVFLMIKVLPILSSVGEYQEDESAMGRIESWEKGFQMLLSSHLLGVGYGQWPEFHWRAAHNSFVQIGSELGIIGLFIWIGLLYWSYKYLIIIGQNVSSSIWANIYSKSLKATLLAYIIASCFANIGYYILLYIFISLIAALRQLYIPENKLHELKQIHLKDLGTIGLIEMLILVAWFVFPRL